MRLVDMTFNPEPRDPPKGDIPANLYCKACGRPNPCDKCVPVTA